MAETRKEQIQRFLAQQSGMVHYSVIAKALGIKTDNCGTVIREMGKEGLVESDGDHNWKITEAGMANLNKIAQNNIKPLTQGELELAAPPKEKPKPEAVKKAVTPAKPKPEAMKLPATLVADEKKVEVEAVKAADPSLLIPREPIMSLSDFGATPYQIFSNMGVMAGVRREILPLVANMVWSGNCYDLLWVWQKMKDCAIPFDLRRIWINAWKSYAVQEYPALAAWEPPTPAQHEAAEAQAKAEAKVEATRASSSGDIKEWLIGANSKIVKVGVGAGIYTLEEAKGIVALDIMKNEAMAAVNTGDPSTRSEKISEILTALAPYIANKSENKSDAASEKISDVLTALAPYISKGGDEPGLMRELLETKFASALEQLESRLPQGDHKPWYETLPAILAAIGAMTPTIKGLLGIPDMAEFMKTIDAKMATQNQTQQPYTILDAEGKPMTMDLKTILEVRKFESEQKRDTEKHKASMEMMGGAREFISKIGAAASRMAGQPK